MKIASITEDGVTVGQHFGRAPYYLVVTVENKKVTGKERRNKAGHHTFASDRPEPTAQQNHGFDAGAQARHASIMENIADCQVLIAGGMGWGAYEELEKRSIEPIVTDIVKIDEAIELYFKGELENLVERLH